MESMISSHRGSRRRTRERGQIIPVFAVFAIVMFSFAALGVDANRDQIQSYANQVAVDQATYSSAHIWTQELSEYGYSGPPTYTNASQDNAVLTAARIAQLNGVSLYGIGSGSPNACVNSPNSSYLDVIYYNVAPTAGVQAGGANTLCTGEPSGWTSKLEVKIPPDGSTSVASNTLPSGCNPVWVCVSVAVTTKTGNFLTGAGNLSTYSSVRAAHSAVAGSAQITSGGQVDNWGQFNSGSSIQNQQGSAGDGTFNTDRWLPTGVGGLQNVKQITQGEIPDGGGTGSFACALETNGTVWCWGANQQGQLGNGTTLGMSTPTEVVGVGGSGYLTGIKQIDAGAYGGIALKYDGTVYTWGTNAQGELGTNNSAVSYSTTPVQAGVSAIKYVSAGYEDYYALSSTSYIWDWGWAQYGELGNGGYGGGACVCSYAPVQVGGNSYVEVQAGGYHAVALTQTGQVWSWGLGDHGQIGNGCGTVAGGQWWCAFNPSPVALVWDGNCCTVNFFTHLGKEGERTSAALAWTGQIATWGDNSNGQLARNGTTDDTEGGWANGSNIKALALSSFSTAVLTSSGNVYVAGANTGGELGLGSLSPANETNGFAEVLASNGSGALSMVQSISGGGNNFMALIAPGTGAAVSFGLDGSGQLGVNSGTNYNYPQKVAALSNVIQVAASVGVEQAWLRADGTVWVAGDNSYGQLGQGYAGGSSAVPVEVTALTAGTVVKVTLGQDYLCALIVNGYVYCWGQGAGGQIGDNAGVSRYSPTLVYEACGICATPLVGAKDIASGGNTTQVLFANAGSGSAGAGSVWCWGGTFTCPNGNSGQKNLAVPEYFNGSSTVFCCLASIATPYFQTEAMDVWGDIYLGGSDNPQGSCPLCFNFARELGFINASDTFNTDYPYPVATTSAGFISMGGGFSASYAIYQDGTLYATGDDTAGTLGDGSADSSAIFWSGSNWATSELWDTVPDPSGVGNFHVIAIGAGSGPTGMAIDPYGGVWAWGQTGNGVLGTGASPPPQGQTVPKKVLSIYNGGQLTNATQVSNGWSSAVLSEPPASTGLYK
jgi:alpha-tubulin suppressor-like RCC1 family protein